MSPSQMPIPELLHRILELGNVEDPGQVPQRILAVARELTGARQSALVMGRGNRSRLAAALPMPLDDAAQRQVDEGVRVAEERATVGLAEQAIVAPLVARDQWLGTLVLLPESSFPQPPGELLPLINLLAQVCATAIDDARVMIAQTRKQMSLREDLAEQDEINRCLEEGLQRRQRLLDQLQQPRRGPYGVERITGNSRSMEKVRTRIARIAPTRLNVLFRGEVGTGRDLAARVCHRLSPFGQGPLFAVPCAAIPEQLAPTELFGYVAGAFTGAQTDRLGLLRQAQGGSVYFDHIEHLPLSVQALLLRVLEERRVLPLGADQPIALDLRFLASSSSDLESRVHAGLFRSDLYHRLAGEVIDLPPLRERVEDLPDLARAILTRAAGEQASIEEGALRLLEGYGWPGNVRELANEMRKAVLACGGTRITRAHIAPRIIGRSSGAVTIGDDPLRDLRSQVREYVLDVYELTGHNRAQTARLLGIARNTLVAHLQAAGLPPGVDA